MMKQLTGKIMEEKLKMGWTTTSFAQYFDTTEDGFLELLNKVFSEKASAELLKRLKKNDRYHRRACRAMLKHKKLESENGVSSQLHNPQNPQIDVESSDFLSGEEVEQPENSSYLKNLENTERELSDELISLESKHKTLYQRRKCLAENLLQEKQVLIGFLKELSKHKETIFKIIADCQDLTRQMHEMMLNISTKRQELENIRSEIGELKKIQIFFYENGEIELLNGESIEMPVLDSDVLFTQLVSSPLLENTTVKIIKQLSCLISLTRYLSQQQIEFNITFGDPEIEIIFENITSN